MNNHPFGDFLPNFPGGSLHEWAFNPLHPTCIKLVTATMVATSLAYLVMDALAR